MRETLEEGGTFPEASANENLLTNAVHGNDWRILQPPEIGEENNFVDHVTVILPCYMGQQELALTFAGLSLQTYPHHLLEVVVVDDGSDPPIKLPSELPFETSIVAQQRDGFGLARARNLGAEKAKDGILIFLDCDMIPEPQLVEAHARWHHVNDFSLTLGFRSHADFSDISTEDLTNLNGPESCVTGRKVTVPQWIEFHMGRTKNLTSDDSDLFRIATGGNLGVRKSFFESVGGFDGDFKQWGGEDIEFGFRAFNSGGVLIPERSAKAWHQGEGASPDANEEASLEQQRNRLSHLIPERTFRNSSPGRSFERPMLTVTIDADQQNLQEVSSQIDSVLSSTFHDLLVGVKISEFHPYITNLERQYGPDPRVSFEDDILEKTPFTSFRLVIPPRIYLRPDDIQYLMNKIEKSGILKVDLGENGEICLFSNRAKKRLEHLGVFDDLSFAGQLFGEKLIAAESLGFSEETFKTGKTNAISAPSLNPPLWQLLTKVFNKIISVRSLGDIRNFGFWSARGLWHVLTRIRFTEKVKNLKTRRHALHSPSWIRLAGEKSYFPHARPWREGAASVEVVLVAPEQEAKWKNSTNRNVVIGREKGIPLAPPIDLLKFNPAGFRHVKSGSKIEKMPDFKNDADFIRKARSTLAVEVDRADSSKSAEQVLKLVAIGVPVILKDMTDAEIWLGESIVSQLKQVNSENLIDQTERERVSVRLRREVLKHHTHPERLKQIRKISGLAEFKEDSVSVVVATKRPEMVNRIIEVVKMQDHENLELVLALHGEGFNDSYNASKTENLPITVLRFPKEEIFGNVLSEASAVSQGEWITKMDDDDWYGHEHVTDLVLASKYSNADLVGKSSEFVYLSNQDKTIRRDLGNSEVESPTLGGGTLLIRTSLLKEIYGWRSLAKGVDVALIEDAIAAGGRIWRTHPFGYLLRRAEGQHTWQVDDRYFLRHADQKWEGKAFRIAEVIEDSESI
tara:strand:+ start:681 stop:3584 length:2904 start_codon:yes stop_codon:yes gene_type:complete